MPQIPDEILDAIILERRLLEGYDLNPVYVSTADRQIAPNGGVFYLFEAFGEDATITTAWDVNGNEITALAGAKLKDGFPAPLQILVIDFVDPGAGKFVQVFVKKFRNETPFYLLSGPVLDGDDTEGGNIDVTDGTYTFTSTTVAYAWYFDGVLLPLETTNTIDPTDEGDYYCIVTATYHETSISTQSNTFTVNA